ncbi:hypothetical protein PybrP1_006572, partial [[Pythium] brassicae (nom. inval.)]
MKSTTVAVTNMADDDDGALTGPVGNMLRCGCPLGRPCTCEMGGEPRSSGAGPDDEAFGCGACVNCRLNASKAPSRRGNKRRCLRLGDFLRSQQFDELEISGDCVLREERVLQQDAAVAARDGGEPCSVQCDHRDAEESAQEAQPRPREGEGSAQEPRGATTEERAEPHTPHRNRLLARRLGRVRLVLEAADPSRDSAAGRARSSRESEREHHKGGKERQAVKLQQSVRDFLRHQRWKRLWSDFKDDVRFAGALEIQASYRMLRAKRARLFLAELRRNKAKEQAAETISRFFRNLQAARRAEEEKQMQDALRTAQEKKEEALQMLERVLSGILCRWALLKWREKQRQATAHAQLRTMVRALLRLTGSLQHRRLELLSTEQCCDDPAIVQRLPRSAVSQADPSPQDTIESRARTCRQLSRLGGLLGLCAAARQASRRRRRADIRVDASQAAQKRRGPDDAGDERHEPVGWCIIRITHCIFAVVMKEWFTASAMQSPIVHGARQAHSTYTESPNLSSLPTSAASASPPSSDSSSWPQALLESPVAADLIALSPNKRKPDVFPTDLPPKVIRHAIAEGFALEEIVAVLYVRFCTARGLQAQMKDVNDVSLVVKALRQRAPLMTNPWKSERVVRHEARPRHLTAVAGKLPVPTASGALPKPRPKPNVKGSSKVQWQAKPAGTVNPARPEPSFFTENLLDSVPGGMNASITRIVLVAAIKAFDPDADAGDGAFALPEDFTADPFQSYLQLESPLLKIRREHEVLEAAKPFVQILTENRCWTGYDLLYNVRGVDELVSWSIPRPLALSIYDVIEQIHRQTSRIGKRNILREMYISPGFDKFLRERKSRESEQALQPPALAASPLSEEHAPPRQPSPAIGSLKDEIRARLERDVLSLPIESLELLSAADVLFKAAFLTCEEIAPVTPRLPPSSRATIDSFLGSLVVLQLEGDAHVLRQRIHDRVNTAKRIADEQAGLLRVLGVKTARDLLVRPLVYVSLSFASELTNDTLQPESETRMLSELEARASHRHERRHRRGEKRSKLPITGGEYQSCRVVDPTASFAVGRAALATDSPGTNSDQHAGRSRSRQDPRSVLISRVRRSVALAEARERRLENRLEDEQPVELVRCMVVRVATSGARRTVR